MSHVRECVTFQPLQVKSEAAPHAVKADAAIASLNEKILANVVLRMSSSPNRSSEYVPPQLLPFVLP